MLRSIWNSLLQEPMDKAVKELRRRLNACVTARSGHFEHSQLLWNCEYEVVTWLSDVVWMTLCYAAFTTFLKRKKSRGSYAAMLINYRQFKTFRSNWYIYVRLWCVNKSVKFYNEMLRHCCENAKKSLGDTFRRTLYRGQHRIATVRRGRHRHLRLTHIAFLLVGTSTSFAR